MKTIHSNIRQTCRLILTVCMITGLVQFAKADRSFVIQFESPTQLVDSLHTSSNVQLPESMFSDEVLALPAPGKQIPSTKQDMKSSHSTAMIKRIKVSKEQGIDILQLDKNNSQSKKIDIGSRHLSINSIILHVKQVKRKIYRKLRKASRKKQRFSQRKKVRYFRKTER
ncbi:MAG: hypothetical protein AAFO69_05825 [Bacteroidota bacterium]